MTIYEDRDSNLWIGTYRGGLNKFKDGKFTSFTTKEGLADDSVWTIYEDRGANLWIGTERGLNKFKDGKFTSFSTKDGLSSDIVKRVYEDKDGNLWIGTFGGGLNRFKDGKFTSINVKDGLSSDIVTTIYEDNEGSLWIGTEGAGLNRLRDGKFTSFTTVQGLSNDLTCAIYEDAEGSLWIGTFGGGLNRLKDGKFTSFTTKEGLSNDFVVSIYEDTEGSLWIGTLGGGLNRFKDRKFTSFTTKDGLSNNFVFSITGDKEGGLWISTSGGGLNRFKDGKFTSLIVDEGLSNVFKILEDTQGSLWNGTSFGLSKLKNGRLTSFTTKDGLSDNTVRSIYEDKEGTLWIVGGGGLNRLNHEKLFSFSTKDGLFDSAAFAVLEDDSNNLWITSHKGIFRVSKNQLNDFADGRISSITSDAYSITDGLKTNECNFGSPAAFRTRDGRLWFATVKGVAMVDPKNIKLNTLQPPVAIEKVIIDGNWFSPRERAEVPSGAGKLEFQFTALSFVAPKKVKFKYKLEGFDKNWIDAGTARTAHYTNIPPGNYRFRLMACNNDGLWNETEATFDFYLRPHFYQTYWFDGSIAFGFMLIGIMLHRLRVGTLEKRKMELERLVDQRTQDLLESSRELQDINRRQADFVSGVSHELKTPLTLIRLYGETLLYGDGFSEEMRSSYYQIITRESERLTHLVDNVLDFSRIDRGLKQYAFREGDLAAVVAETIEVHMQHLRRLGFAVEVNLAPDLPPMQFDAGGLSEVVLNLLDNAAKYSGEKKYISVALRAEASDVVLEIEDQGIGIPSSEQEMIFQQFFRGANSAEKGGYGLGLFLVKHIMDAHGAAIEVKSEAGRGSLFRLLFPINHNGSTKGTASVP
jgi:signal transduction histidine kinase/ligand-binding sensor domain-containing protein